jgi:hypothetical protein
MQTHLVTFTILQLALLVVASNGMASDAAEEEPAQAAAPQQPETAPASRAGNLVRLAVDYDVWMDTKRKLVVVDGEICLREGMLEMFACPRGTKEHESIVAVNSRPYFVHTALLAVGAQAGRPVQFAPEYVPATGTTVDILVLWVDEDGQRHRSRAQDWIKNMRTERAMEHDWVFAGSGFWVDEETGEQHYLADGGDFICVANFGTAMLDLPVKSPQDNADLLFTAFTERIPPLGTKVRLVLIPRLDTDQEATSD